MWEAKTLRRGRDQRRRARRGRRSEVVVFDRDDLQLLGAGGCPERHRIADATADQSACERGDEGDPPRGRIRLVDSHDLHVLDGIALIPRRHVGTETDLVSIGGRHRDDSRGDMALQLQTTRARGRRQLGAKALQTATGDVIGRALGKWRAMADDHRLLGTVLVRERFAHQGSIRRRCRTAGSALCRGC